MDIIDIMLARAMTPQGQTDIYVGKANAAAAKAEKAKTDAAEAVATVEAAADEIATAREEAASLLEEAQEALETAQAAQINTLDTEDVDDEIKKLNVSINNIDASNYKQLQVVTTYPDNTLHTENITKLYKLYGDNEDGTMTLKAIKTYMTDSLATKADITYVDNAISHIPSGGGGSGSGNMSGDIDSDDAGHLVSIDENGNLTPSTITDEEMIEALIKAGTYSAKNAVGLDIDYANRICTRTQEAYGKSMGIDFNKYKMYGGRMKCNVSDNGAITAFYGDNNYKEDGSNGQVMIYQPKFYYKRVIRTSEESARGTIIRHEVLIISDTEQPGFKLAPIFNDNLEYVLLPAYDGSVVENKLASIAGVKPINNLTRALAENYATARGTGWHIMNMAAESANLMLEIVEFGSMNGQDSIELGISYSPEGSNGQGLFITGSTASLGNGTGHAESTDMDVNGTILTQTENGKRAISYRGMENPWGNLWSMIGGVNIVGNGLKGGGEILICKDFNYAGNNYESIGFQLPIIYGWINAMGYGTAEYDWVYIPIECSTSANSYIPVGDGLWTVGSLNGQMIIATGGSYGYKEECGPFYYAADRTESTCAKNNYGAKLLFIPTKNSIYNANITKWNNHMGG